MDGENQRANDNDRYVLAAQPGKSQGRPKETSPRSKRIVQTGLPDCVLPESPCPGQPTVWSEPDSNLPSMIFMPRDAVVCPRAELAPALGCERAWRHEVAAPKKGRRIDFLATFWRPVGQDLAL
jgi:hypothetical protein